MLEDEDSVSMFPPPIPHPEEEMREGMKEAFLATIYADVDEYRNVLIENSNFRTVRSLIESTDFAIIDYIQLLTNQRGT